MKAIIAQIQIPDFLKHPLFKKFSRYLAILLSVIYTAIIIWAFQSRSLADLESWHKPVTGEFTKSHSDDKFTKAIALGTR